MNPSEVRTLRVSKLCTQLFYNIKSQGTELVFWSLITFYSLLARHCVNGSTLFQLTGFYTDEFLTLTKPLFEHKNEHTVLWTAKFICLFITKIKDTASRVSKSKLAKITGKFVADFPLVTTLYLRMKYTKELIKWFRFNVALKAHAIHYDLKSQLSSALRQKSSFDNSLTSIRLVNYLGSLLYSLELYEDSLKPPVTETAEAVKNKGLALSCYGKSLNEWVSELEGLVNDDSEINYKGRHRIFCIGSLAIVNLIKVYPSRESSSFSTQALLLNLQEGPRDLQHYTMILLTYICCQKQCEIPLEEKIQVTRSVKEYFTAQPEELRYSASSIIHGCFCDEPLLLIKNFPLLLSEMLDMTFSLSKPKYICSHLINIKELMLSPDGTMAPKAKKHYEPINFLEFFSKLDLLIQKSKRAQEFLKVKLQYENARFFYMSTFTVKYN